MRTADTGTDTDNLNDLSDPALITYWAGVRGRLALTPRDDPRYAAVKRLYDAALAEYRRRVAAS